MRSKWDQRSMSSGTHIRQGRLNNNCLGQPQCRSFPMGPTWRPWTPKKCANPHSVSRVAFRLTCPTSLGLCISRCCFLALSRLLPQGTIQTYPRHCQSSHPHWNGQNLHRGIVVGFTGCPLQYLRDPRESLGVPRTRNPG
jgi:hypothetical protein